MGKSLTTVANYRSNYLKILIIYINIDRLNHYKVYCQRRCEATDVDMMLL